MAQPISEVHGLSSPLTVPRGVRDPKKDAANDAVSARSRAIRSAWRAAASTLLAML